MKPGIDPTLDGLPPGVADALARLARHVAEQGGDQLATVRELGRRLKASVVRAELVRAEWRVNAATAALGAAKKPFLITRALDQEPEIRAELLRRNPDAGRAAERGR